MTSGMISARKRRKMSNNRPRKRAAGTYSISIDPRKIRESTSKEGNLLLLKKKGKKRKRTRLS
jgi:hypothetical protein